MADRSEGSAAASEIIPEAAKKRHPDNCPGENAAKPALGLRSQNLSGRKGGVESGLRPGEAGHERGAPPPVLPAAHPLV